MKRLLFVAVLAAALLGLLAAPALGTLPNADFRLSENTAYIFAYNDGSWGEVADVAAGVFVFHWVTYDDEGNFVAPADPIPANYDVVMQVSWKLIPRGQVQTLPNKFLISLNIPEAGVALSYQQAKAYWTLHPWDEYWSTYVLAIPAFNPRIGAKPWANTWLAPLTGESGLADNLTADMKLPPGTYTVNYTERVARPFTTIELVWDDEGNPMWGPTHAERATSPVEFTFIVE